MSGEIQHLSGFIAYYAVTQLMNNFPLLMQVYQNAGICGEAIRNLAVEFLWEKQRSEKWYIAFRLDCVSLLLDNILQLVQSLQWLDGQLMPLIRHF